MTSKNEGNTKGYSLYNQNGTFVSPIYAFYLAGNIIVYTPIQGTNRRKDFERIVHEGKVPTLAGTKHLSVHFFFQKPRLFHHSAE